MKHPAVGRQVFKPGARVMVSTRNGHDYGRRGAVIRTMRVDGRVTDLQMEGDRVVRYKVRGGRLRVLALFEAFGREPACEEWWPADYLMVLP